VKIAHFFIDRPIFACAVSVIITLLGAITLPRLAVDQYPRIAPPTVTVSASYPGASAEVMADNVAAPLEQQINGVDDMLYMSSQSIGEGRVAITVTFRLGTDVDLAQVKVQNRVQTALPQLPQEVQNLGVSVRKGAGDTLLIVHMTATDPQMDRKFLANYASLQVRERLLRVPGVGDVGVNAARDYAMRVWIDPDKAAARNLTVQEIVDALRNNNVQVAAGAVGAPPFTDNPASSQLIVQTAAKLETADEFARVIIKRDSEGRITRVSDIGRVELGAQNYGINAYKNQERAVALSVTQSPGSNALEVADAVLETMRTMQLDFPAGIAYEVIYNPSEYIRASVVEVQRTLMDATILVVIVVILFLQSWRTALIPLLAIPVSIIGACAVLGVFGFSLNNLSMFGLVLAIGIVIDDAIVVVENVERHMRAGMPARQAAHVTMDEVGGALVGIAAVLVAVFVPTAFMGGIAGQFYKQFALTIASATAISLVVSLSLTPALCAIVLKPHFDGGHSWIGSLGARMSAAFDRFGERYGGLSRRVIRASTLMLVLYGGLLALAGWRIIDTPRGFIPAQDNGTVSMSVQLPVGATLARTDALTQQILDIMMKTPGVHAISTYAGIDGNGFNLQSSSTQLWAIFDPWDERLKKGLTVAKISADLRQRLSVITGADIRISQPAPVMGLGSAGGFKMMIEDRGGNGYAALEAVTRDLAEAASKDPAITNTYVGFNSRSPRLNARVDRDKAEMLGVPSGNVFATMQTYLAGTYVNNINLIGHTFQVIAMADAPFRQDATWVGTLKTRSESGAMVPLSSVATFEPAVGPYKVFRYNLYPAADIQGETRPGASTGQAMAAMERIARARLPAGFTFEWTDIAYQQQLAGNSGSLSFVLAVVFVFIFLAALYESLTLPLAVILIVPMCLLAAMLGVNFNGTDNNILTQIGMVVLIGLAAKNAILIVEFARQAEEQLGMTPAEAAAHAARTRLRPIIMTSVAFVAGVAPLAFGSGAGAEMRHALGIAVFFGMIGVTVFGLLFTPVFYVACRWLSTRFARRPKAQAAPEAPIGPEGTAHRSLG
jgi:hydrophobe/amphiphile efflux-1 (HAE1) family protein